MPSPTGKDRPPSGPDTSSDVTHEPPSRSASRFPRGELVPGTRLRIVDRLDRGAVGELYRAIHVDLDRPVALKVLSEAPDAEAVARFRREAALTTRIDSPHVVQVLDYGMLHDGRPYYVMPWLGGRSLDIVICKGPVDAARVIGLLRMACKGLAAAHALSITHRDVKPENLMLVEGRGGPERLVVVDFGLATSSGSVPELHGGTPTYMAPEQIVGLPIDERADVYALGCVGYELLTGRTPFVGPTIVALLRQHADCEPDPPSGLCPEPLPRGLEGVILRCLEKVPERRFPSMIELEAALCEVQIASGACTPWDPLPPPEVDPRRRSAMARGLYAPKSHRASMPRAALFVLALVAGAAPFLDPGPPETSHETIATLAEDDEETSEDRDETPALSSAQLRADR
jgi:serine/threonine protein kinase